ncbi:MAG: hypothetical protein E7Z83_03005 [Methanobrevibacter sp.]|nr:hypothetical protein [Methanobrevibacter sp.]MBE6489809.1 hypothetical protein [Methanobrevibacter sp.]
MIITNTDFEKEFQELNNIYTMRNPKKIHEFIKENEGLLKLLNETHPYLISKFPNGEFELQAHEDITGEGYHKIYINIFVDDETFNNGFMDGIHEIHEKIIPIEKEMNLMMKMILMPGIKGY